MNSLESLKGKGVFDDIDFHFAGLMRRLAGAKAPETLYPTCVLLSHLTLQGKNICLDIRKMSGRPLIQCVGDAGEEQMDIVKDIRLPADADAWIKSLMEAPVTGLAAAQKMARTPLVLDGAGRLYIHRYWDYERRLADAIRAKAPARALDNPERWGAMLKAYFAGQTAKNPKWQIDEGQILAVFLALRNRFSVISGGPGTGKTTIVSAVLSLLLEDARSKGDELDIAVCAPTGKAAVRIQESLRKNLGGEAANNITIEAKTIHRLLGYIPGSPYFRHNSGNTLPADIVVVDEASMVSLPLMSKLFKAMRPDAKAILLGDKNQLASVESGAILADICAAADINRFTEPFAAEFAKFAEKRRSYDPPARMSPMSDTAVSLEKSFRFPPDKGIAKVSGLVNANKAELALEEIKKDHEDVRRIELPPPKKLKPAIEEFVAASTYASFHLQPDLKDAYRMFNEFRILCSNRRGDFGVERINVMVMEILAEKYRIDISSGEDCYKGRPIIITENDYALRLFNGDTGIVWDAEPDSETGAAELRAYFPRNDMSGEFSSFPISRLPAHETAYAMTIHKAQGSGFKKILVVLPDKHSPILTRELVYTGITRAEEHASVMMKDDVFKKAVERTVERSSGLQELLNS